MLPIALYQRNLSVEGERIVLNYLTERDHVWLRALCDEYARHAGSKQKELRQRLCEPLSVFAPKWKKRAAEHVLDRLCQARHAAPVPPREIRQVLFHLAAERGPCARSLLLSQAAATLGVGAGVDLEEALFADLTSERLVGELPKDLGPHRLAEQVNLAMVGALLARAREVRITAQGQMRALVRQARLTGLICVVERAESGVLSTGREPQHPDAPSQDAAAGAVLSISGPYALFRQTRIYGRALAQLVPRVAWCHDYELVATCVLKERDEPLRLLVKSGDPIPAGKELKRFDSQVEERFARAFGRLARDWELIREPAPISAGSRLIFPDFELFHRQRPDQRWYLEIAGFWTDDYLKNKLAQLKICGLRRLIVCIDDKLRCSQGELPDQATLIRYRRRIDPKQVLAVLESRLNSGR